VSLLVTDPVIRIRPRFGMYDGARASIVTASGVSSAAAGRAWALPGASVAVTATRAGSSDRGRSTAMTLAAGVASTGVVLRLVARGNRLE
jgi:hypothetical protein